MLLRNKNVKEYIGVFDSGAGGVTVLKECTKLLPEENFYYYGDSKHAPYGEKSVKEVQDRTLEAMNQMVNHGVKAIVIACNTATSAAVNIVRNVYPQIPVIGVEPALKPAASAHQKVLVMATRNTLCGLKQSGAMPRLSALSPFSIIFSEFHPIIKNGKKHIIFLNNSFTIELS